MEQGLSQSWFANLDTNWGGVFTPDGEKLTTDGWSRMATKDGKSCWMGCMRDVECCACWLLSSSLEPRAAYLS